MRAIMLTTALSTLFAVSPAHAQGAPAPSSSDDFHPTIMLGLAFELGRQSPQENIGLTAKLLSTNEEDHFVVGGGLTYFPWSDDALGLDVGAGYNFKDAAAIVSYDFLRKKPQISGGWVPTDDESSAPVAPSDARLKRDIKLLATLDDGLKIYAFKYKWSDAAFVGVMAQDLLRNPAWRGALLLGESGYYRVDYRKLGLRMVTLEIWNERGLAAIVRPERLATIAMPIAA